MTTRRQAAPRRPRERPSPYFVCGVLGYLAGLVVSMVAAWDAGMATPGRVIVATVPVTTLLISVRLSAAIVGSERLVFLENAIATAATTAIALALAGERVLVGLDAMILGVGVFQIFGRVGCHLVGCCHGRPCRIGVRYGAAHARQGFPAELVGVRLAPVQLADSALSGLAVAAAAVAYWRPPDIAGEATILYAILYAVGRFGLELLRADPRPYRAGLSEAQWTALAITLAGLAWRQDWIAGAAAAVLAAASLFLGGRHALRRRREGRASASTARSR
jgi:prolipoprotein diacylglyceryltransferase